MSLPQITPFSLRCLGNCLNILFAAKANHITILTLRNGLFLPYNALKAAPVVYGCPSAPLFSPFPARPPPAPFRNRVRYNCNCRSTYVGVLEFSACARAASVLLSPSLPLSWHGNAHVINPATAAKCSLTPRADFLLRLTYN